VRYDPVPDDELGLTQQLRRGAVGAPSCRPEAAAGGIVGDGDVAAPKGGVEECLGDERLAAPAGGADEEAAAVPLLSWMAQLMASKEAACVSFICTRLAFAAAAGLLVEICIWAIEAGEACGPNGHGIGRGGCGGGRRRDCLGSSARAGGPVTVEERTVAARGPVTVEERTVACGPCLSCFVCLVAYARRRNMTCFHLVVSENDVFS
jgi:hypothetical protein